MKVGVEMNPDIIPKMNSITAKEKHIHCEINWKLFAQKMQRNPFMRNYKIGKTDRCARCGERLKNFQLHHIDYDHFCQFNEAIRMPNQTAKRPNRTILVPDCEGCKINSPEVFEECAKRVVPVHPFCNKLINDKMEIYLNNDNQSEQLSLFDDY